MGYEKEFIGVKGKKLSESGNEMDTCSLFVFLSRYLLIYRKKIFSEEIHFAKLKAKHLKLNSY